MKELLKFFKGYRLQSVLAPLFKMAEATLELLVPLIVKDMIDAGIANGDPRLLAARAGLLVLMALVGLGFSLTAQFFSAKTAVGVSTALRGELFRRVTALSYPDIDRLGTSNLITRLTSDVNQIQNGVNLTLRLLLRSPCVVLGAVVMAFQVDAYTARVFAGAVPVLSVVIAAVMFGTMPLYKQVQKRLDAVTKAVRENLNGVRVLRAFAKEDEEIRGFGEKNGAFTAAAFRAGRVSALMNPLTYVLINLAVVLLIRLGALRVNEGLLTQGAVVAQYNYMSQILVELVKLASLIVTVSRALASAGRVQEVLRVTPSIACPETGAEPDFSAPAVEFRNVSLRYGENSEDSLSEISFSAQPGEKIGLIGATGSGKTSVVNLIPRFYDATAGEVYVFGHDVRSYSAETLSSLVAVVPQKAVLFAGTIRENLLWGDPSADDAALADAVRRSQSENIIENKEGGLDAAVEQNGRNLSGGQRQRLTIARALVRQAPILILDDAAAALDAATEKALRTALSTLDPRPCVFVVSQRSTAVADCDKILVTADGRLTGCGTHAELLEQNETYRYIYDCEMRGNAHA